MRMKASRVLHRIMRLVAESILAVILIASASMLCFPDALEDRTLSWRIDAAGVLIWTAFVVARIWSIFFAKTAQNVERASARH